MMKVPAILCIFLLSTLSHSCIASWIHIVTEVYLRMNVLESVRETCGTDPKVRGGLNLLKRDLHTTLKELGKMNDRAALRYIRDRGENPMKTNKAPTLTGAEAAEATAITNHLCSTKRFDKNLYGERAWYKNEGFSTPQFTIQQEMDNKLDEASSEEIFSHDSIESAMEENDKISKSWSPSSYETLMIGLVMGAFLGHYFYMLKNSIVSMPHNVQRNLRRPEL